MHSKALQAPKQTVSLTAALFILTFIFSSWHKWETDGVPLPEVSVSQPVCCTLIGSSWFLDLGFWSNTLWPKQD